MVKLELGLQTGRLLTPRPVFIFSSMLLFPNIFIYIKINASSGTKNTIVRICENEEGGHAVSTPELPSL